MDPERECCCWDWLLDRGADAYNESIDCFKSGRDVALLFPGVVALEGLPGEFAVDDPKKSKPRRESPVLFGLCCDAAVAGPGGGRPTLGTAELERGTIGCCGEDGPSSKRSTAGGWDFGGGGG